MSITNNSVTTGDNTLAHVATASGLGAALSVLVTWGFTLAQITVPDKVEEAFGVLCAVAASWLMQKISG